MKVRVRRAQREDFNTLARLVRALADYERLEPPSEAAQHRLLKDGWPESGGARFQAWLVEEIDGANVQAVPIGYAITFFTYSSFLAKPTLYLEDLFILPEHRRGGAGSAIFDSIKAFAGDCDCGRIEWVVLDWNTTAQQFYRKIGARYMEEWHSYRLTLNSP